jgi:hypothetical protein
MHGCRGISGLVRRCRRAADHRLQPVHVATWIKAGTRRQLAAPSVKQRLARFVIGLIGSSLARLCRSIRPARCVGLGM